MPIRRANAIIDLQALRMGTYPVTPGKIMYHVYPDIKGGTEGKTPICSTDDLETACAAALRAHVQGSEKCVWVMDDEATVYAYAHDPGLAVPDQRDRDKLNGYMVRNNLKFAD